MKKVLIVLAMVLGIVGMVQAQEVQTQCQPQCLPVQVSCECNCATAELPGLYRVNIANKIQCGTITVLPSGFLFQGHEDGIPTAYVYNTWKRADRVETCK